MFLDKLNQRLKDNEFHFIGEETAFRSAVLIPLVQMDGEWHILFEVRSFSMRKQPGDISFPGGRIDSSDPTPWAAALRETQEELGVDPNTVTLVRQLSPYVASPAFVVYPFVATIEYSEIIPSYNPEEVEEVFTVPVKWFLNNEPYLHVVPVQATPESNFPFDKIMNGEQYKWRSVGMEEWFFDYKQYTIWGLTARILKHLIDIIK